MRGTVWAALLAASAGCSKRADPADPAGTCLPVAPAVRRSLLAAPDGHALYWLEAVRVLDFDANLDSYWNLVRFDLRTRQTQIVLDHVVNPLVFLQDQLIAARGTDSLHAVLLAGDGHVQELTPDYLDVYDIEVLDRHTLALLADGDGERAVYKLDLAELRPQYLFDADILLSTSGGTIYARDDDDGIAYDVKTGTRTPFPPIDNAMPSGDDLVFVESNRVQIQRMTSADPRTLIFEPRDWKLEYQTGSLLVRSPPRADRSFAYVVADGRANQLATVVGGASILGTTAIGDRTWALIGHNSSNYTGDLRDAMPEADVCVLPSSGEVTFATRQVPARFTAQADRLFRAFAAAADGALQILELRGEPTTFSMHLKNDPGVFDWAHVRKRTRELYDRVTSLVNDREVRTEVIFSDRRRGVHRWRREQLRYRTLAGMGDALLTDPEDFDVEVSDLKNERSDDKITCAGLLKNPRSKPLTDLTIKCSGNRNHVIEIGDLAPNADHRFDQTFDTEYGEAAYLEVIDDGKPLELRNLDIEAQTEKVLDIALTVHGAHELSLVSHEVDKEITIDLLAETRFLGRDRAAQEAAIIAAYESYEAIRGIYHVDAKSPIELRVEVELSDVSFTYDGTRLRRDDR